MKRLFLTLIVFVLAGCATPRIDRSYTAKSQDSRIQYLILHYTADNFDPSLKVLTQGPVSAHYLVDDKPVAIYGLVDDSQRAYHAGVSYWHGDTSLNASSIGIEIVNRGFIDDKNMPGAKIYFDFPPEQIDAVLALAKKIVAQYHIKPEHVLGHSDIAPQRKYDPGPRFPWKRFADAGLIVWPNADTVAARKPLFEQNLPDAQWFQARLAQHGYQVMQSAVWDLQTRNVLAAFQMKYRPSLFDGVPDAESAAMLDTLTSPLLPSPPQLPPQLPPPSPILLQPSGSAAAAHR